MMQQAHTHTYTHTQAAPVLSTFIKGRTAGAQLFAIINRVPQIDADDEGGLQLEKVCQRNCQCPLSPP